jgi:hypothetical protein
LRTFIDDDKKDISYLEIDAARIRREATAIVRHVERLTTTLTDLDVDEFLGEEELWEHLERLLAALKKKLAAADRRLG